MGSRRSSLTFGALAVWLLALALVRPLSVDESQYVAATALAAKGLLPYRDFAYLQVPLQPLVFAPLGWLFPDHLLIAMRVVNALLSLATIVFVYGAARGIGARQGSALVSAAMLASCQSFIWSAGIARNDMLPAALMAFGLWYFVAGSARTRFVAGVLFGLAAGTKISYAVPSATIFVAGLWTRNPAEWRRALAFAAGVAVGLVPAMIVAAMAPRAFLAEAIVFPGTAPTQYYTSIGKAWRLGPARFLQLLECAAIGPALIAAIEIGRRSWKERWWDDPVRRALLAAVAGGLISAILNKPFQIFYLLPALPPLFVLAPLLFSGKRPRWLSGAWALFAVVGLVPALAWFVRAGSGGAPALDADRRSAALAAALRDEQVQGSIGTLAGQYVASVDPRFAAGPFLYRTRGFLSSSEAREWKIVTQDQIDGLSESPPSAIVTGVHADSQPELEAKLGQQAQALGYRPTANVAGFTIWTRRP